MIDNKTVTSTGRLAWLDYMRVTACFLVMLVHSTEPFYLGGEGTRVLTSSDAYWVSVFEGLARCCVPLFVIASGYLLLPLRYSTGTFFRRRAVRILIPMLIWTLVYALVWGEPVANLKGLLLNFNYAAGHLWFVYMLLGLYLIMPLLSPWLERVSRKELGVYLGIWLLTTLFPLVRQTAGGPAPLIQAWDGLPAPALFPLWGEASWNPFGLFYYLSGFMGYLLLGVYIKRFVPSGRPVRVQGWTLFLTGFILVCFGFLRHICESGYFPVEGPVALAVNWECAIAFCGLPVVLTALGLTLVFRQDHCHAGRNEASWWYRRIILPLSMAGYGMYLTHMLVLGPVSAFFREKLGLGPDGLLGVWTTPVQILAAAMVSFVIVGAVCTLVRRIPRVGRWLMG